MLSQIEQAKQKWGGAHDAIDLWLLERQALLVQYCKIAGMPPFQRENDALPSKSAISQFCQVLVDYVSAGHFEVYDKIVEESENSNVALYPEISATTDDALTFNDAYANIGEDNDLRSFDDNLSSLGQRLEERFELEDRLIQSIHSEKV